MANLLNIIHPYTYKLEGTTLNLGPVEEFKERDEKLRYFVDQALNYKTRVLIHHHRHPKSIDGAMVSIGFHVDPLFKFMFDPRIKQVVTTLYGAPLPDERIETISEDQWNLLKDYFTSDSNLRRIVGKPKNIFFIGGVLEKCLCNAAAHFLSYQNGESQKIFYIPELCVSFDQTQREITEGKLKDRSIESISAKEAIKILKLKK
jgi:hypothetical protein